MKRIYKDGIDVTQVYGGRDRWVQRTRESVLRRLDDAAMPLILDEIHGHLDITEHPIGSNTIDPRTLSEVRFALLWLTVRGWVSDIKRPRREREWRITDKGRAQALYYKGPMATERTG